jgi:RNA polymerase sigma-70 factor (ECF subfamily)
MTQDIQDVPTHPTDNPTLAPAIQAHLGSQLRALYGDPAEERLPRGLAQLADRVAQVIRAHTEPVDQDFIDGIMGSLSSLRAFALSLTRDIHQAEDLVQETVLKAISKQERFEAGTSLQAWLFTILRNLYFSAHRKAKREVEDADGSHAAAMISIPDQEDKIVVQDLETALDRLPQEQREAILLVGAEGMAYEEAAKALGVKAGTIKSRVNRARNRLAEMMGLAGKGGIAGSRSVHVQDPG